MTDEELAAIERATGTFAQSDFAFVILVRSLIAEVRRLRAEVARLASVATEACDVAEANIGGSGECGAIEEARGQIADLRKRIPTPDRAAVVAAVERYGEAADEAARMALLWGDDKVSTFDRTKAIEEADAAKAALLALWGVR